MTEAQNFVLKDQVGRLALVDQNKSDGRDCGAKCLQEVFAAQRQVSAENKPSDRNDLKPGPLKDVPEAKVSVEGNQFYLDYRSLHLPTFSEKNPDGSANKPFVSADRKIERKDGLPEVQRDSQGRTIGRDDAPLYDANGMRRFDLRGLPMTAQFDATDPVRMLKNLQNDPSALSEDSRVEYNKAIESADKLDRVAIARKLEQNEQFVMRNSSAYLWENSYRQVHDKSTDLADEIASSQKTLTPAQVEAFSKMSAQVKSAGDLDKWLNDAGNKALKDELKSTKNGVEITNKFGEYLQKEDELKAKSDVLDANPKLKDKVARIREIDGSNEEFGRLLSSSLETRQAYLGKLLDQDSVKKLVAINDKHGIEARSLANDADVREAKRIVLELAKQNPALLNHLKETAKSLGLSDLDQR